MDATGDPYDFENVAESKFEQSAVKQLVKGKPYVEEVISKDGKRFLLAATPIPVVMDRCVTCHDDYADVPKGQASGAISYVVPDA